MRKIHNGCVVDMTPQEQAVVQAAEILPAEQTAEQRLEALEKAVFSVLKRLGL